MPPMLLPDGVSIRSMTPADVAAGLALCRASHWNQTEQDWRFFLTEAPHGALVAEEERTRHRHGRDASLRSVHVDIDGARRSRRSRQACGHDAAAARARARRRGRDGAPRCDSRGRSDLSHDRIRQRISPRPMVSRRHAADRSPIRRATSRPTWIGRRYARWTSVRLAPRALACFDVSPPNRRSTHG